MPSMPLIEMDPPIELRFCKTAEGGQVKETLKLTNKTDGYVAFKVKTTAPKSYVVRPSSGVVGPKTVATVDIYLQPGGEGQSHRFLVQAHPVDSGEPLSREQFASFQKENIEEQRLNVVFEEAAGSPAVGKTSYQPGSSPDAGRSKPSAVAGGETLAELKPKYDDLKAKYDELEKYTLLLEKQKRMLESDGKSNVATRRSSGDSDGYTKVHIILAALLAFILSYAVKFLG
eukprot:TRINITY_DN24451_c0_g1_i1.p1 TRINITY_DN24451_c0_g1~~TRINITY_DN24451_c0_g1_i1.p1  ORF type:complete len:230 (-),score=44.96 TRINITY_DN24451_c0_g1_i1:74-763(-)